MNIVNCTELALKEFLVKAKKNTYAGDGVLSTSSRPNSKDLKYTEGNFLYIDSYFGSTDFIGEEVVFEKTVPAWGMNYYGKMLVPSTPEGFSTCLKSALRAIPLEYPFRGPNVFEYEGFTYKCSWQGSLSDFIGNEMICHNGTCIYKLSFQGVYIK